MALLKSDPKTLQKGDQAPSFTLENVDGSAVSLSDFSGKAVVVIFMCNHCPYVIPKMQEIADIQNEYSDVAVICISSNDIEYVPEDGPEHMKEIAKKFGYQYYLYDETQEVAQSYGATCTPDPFVFDTNHKLVYHGRINDALDPSSPVTIHHMKEVLDKILAKEEIEEWFLPSMGCSIKWKS